MPPLSTFLFVTFAVLVVTIFARVLAEFRSELPLPFISDASHGICAQCGDSCPDSVECGCGCSLSMSELGMGGELASSVARLHGDLG